MFKKSIIDLNYERRAVRFLDRMEDYTSEIDKNNIETIIKVLMDIGDLLDDGYAGMMKPDTQMRILRITHQLIFRFDTQIERFNILAKTVRSVNESIYPIVHKIGTLDQAW